MHTLPRPSLQSVVTPWMVVGLIALSSPVVQAQSASQKAEPPFNSSPLPGLIEMILGLGIVLILAYLSIRFLGKRSQIRQRGSIELIAARQLAPNKSVQVIGVQGKRFLIGVGDQITLLADVTEDYDVADDIEEPDRIAGGQAFAALLAQALQSARSRYRPDSRKGDEP